MVSWGWVRVCLLQGTVHGGNCLNVFDILMENFMTTGINGFLTWPPKDPKLLILDSWFLREVSRLIVLVCWKLEVSPTRRKTRCLWK